MWHCLQAGAQLGGMSLSSMATASRFAATAGMKERDMAMTPARLWVAAKAGLGAVVVAAGIVAVTLEQQHEWHSDGRWDHVDEEGCAEEALHADRGRSKSREGKRGRSRAIEGNR